MLGTLLDRCPLALSHRLQHLLWAVEALGCRVPYLSDHGLRSTVALGTGGYLLLVGREIHAPQILLEFAQVEVTQTAQVHVRSPVCSYIWHPAYPSPVDHKHENARPLYTPDPRTSENLVKANF